MAEVEEIKDETIATIESELDVWEGFYKKFKGDFSRIEDYERKIEKLEGEIEKKNSLLRQRIKKDKGIFLLLTALFIVVTLVFIRIISNSINVWLYFYGGFLIGLGAFSLLYILTR
jgi:hypothetical protein